MEEIFHEKQEGSLCAQHCLNALLQGSYFTAVDLGTLAQGLDDEERRTMAESGVDTEEYRRFLAQPSGNMDDSGFFSVQVLSSALQVWGLELLPYNSEEAFGARQNPAAMAAFICNMREHWFTVRKLGNQWFNLNSLMSRPQLISDTYLAMFLAQLQTEGYSIFVVRGSLPSCSADSALLLRPCDPSLARSSTARPSHRARTSSEDEDPDLKTALALSLAEDEKSAGGTLERSSSVPEDTDHDLQTALALSLEVASGRARQSSSSTSRPLQPVAVVDLAGEEEELERALRLSLECGGNSQPTTPTVDQEEVRRRRLAFLDGMSKPSSSS